MTRSELSRSLELNRSTIGVLVEQLVAGGLVKSGPPSTTRSLGRPSLTVFPGDLSAVLVVYPETDAVTVGIVQLGGRVLIKERTELDRPPSSGLVLDITQHSVRRLSASSPVGLDLIGVGIAVPGVIRPSDGVIAYSPPLHWTDEPLASRMETLLELPVQIENEARVAARAERAFGAARGIDFFAYLHDSASGIGGALMAAGAPLPGAHGLAGEFGHMPLTDPGAENGAKSWRDLGEALHEGPRVGPSRRSDEWATTRGRSSDPHPFMIEALAAAVTTIVVSLDPERVVIGGQLASVLQSQPDRILSRVLDAVHPISGDSIDIRPAEITRDQMLIGAAELVFARLFQSMDIFGESG